jgi:ParB/RepB/Spo0J family partition protein
MQVQNIPVSQIKVDSQIRKSFDPAKHEELCGSIRSLGVLEPLIVRQADESGFYPLIAGERRLRAAKDVGLTEVPCSIAEVSPLKVFDLQFAENGHREEVSALEEADAIAEQHFRFALPAVDIARKMGKSVGLVLRRLKLVQLCDEVKNALKAGQISLAVAEKLSVLTVRRQKTELKTILRDASENDYAKKLEETYIPLVGCPFNPEDSELVTKTPPCSECPKRAQMSIFGNEDLKNTCPDKDCFRKKADADWNTKAKDAAGRGWKVLDPKEAKSVFASGSGYISIDDEAVTPDGESTWRKALEGHVIPDPIFARNPRTLQACELYGAPNLRAIVRKALGRDAIDRNPKLDVPMPQTKVDPPPTVKSNPVDIEAAYSIGKKADPESVLYAAAKAIVESCSIETLQAVGVFDGKEGAIVKLGSSDSDELCGITTGLLASILPGISASLTDELSLNEEPKQKAKKKTPKK